MRLKEFLKDEEITLLNSTIKSIEKRTKSKIRIYITEKIGRYELKKAREIFVSLNLRNELKNNVIFIISLKDKKIGILGDDGIAEKVNEGFWLNTVNAVAEKFKSHEFAIGLIGGINLVAEKVIEFFPDEKEENSLEQIIFYEK